jgi:macrolide transport system ATP-binding/permease protein
MLADFRYSVRALAKHPSFVVAGIVVLGLAVGVNTAVFSLINALLLRPLPVATPGQLAFVYANKDRVTFPYSWYLELRQKTDVFSGLAARGLDRARMRAGEEIVPLQGEAVSDNYFDVLGIAPRLGRAFLPSDMGAATPVAIISDSLWRAQFNSDPSVLGRVLTIDIPVRPNQALMWRSFTIIGVAPRGFGGTGSPWEPAQYWVLREQRAADYPRIDGADPRRGGNVVPIGRLRAGVTFAAARASVETAGREIIEHSSEHVGDLSFQLRQSRRVTLPFAGAYYIDLPRVIATLSAVATMLLMVAATNLAGMLMARGVARQTEIALRLSLGATPLRLARQLLAESALLAAGGTLLGLGASRLLVRAATGELPSQMPGVNPMMLTVDVPLDAHVVLFAVATCLLTALIAGLAPAIATVRTDLLASLTNGAVIAPRQTRAALRRIVLVPQVALSLLLLLVAGLFVRNVLRVELAASGYDAAHVALLKVQLPLTKTLATKQDMATAADRARETFQRMLDSIGTIPEVMSAAVTQETIQGVGLAESYTSVIARSDYRTTNRYRSATVGRISANYFTTLGIPLLHGRRFDLRDRTASATTTIVSEKLANQLWPGKNPVGEWLAFHSPDAHTPPQWLEVVGVVASVTLPLEESPRPVFYVPIESNPLLASTVLVRGHGNLARLIDGAKQAIRQADRTAIVTQARALEDAVNAVRYPRRFSAALLSVSGVAGLALAALGVFALMSYAVAQRLGEIGVRMVLGAQRRDVIRLILRDGVGVAVSGILAGFALAFAAVRYASHAIVPLPDADAVTFIVVPVVLILMVLLACLLPARRAARVDPLVVLRNS